MDSALAGQTAGPLALPFQKTRGPSLKPAVFTLKYKPEVLTLEPPLPSSAPGGSLGARPGSARHSAAQRGRPSGQRRPRSLLQAPCGGRGRAAGPGQGAPSPPRPRRVRGGPPCRPPPAPARLRPPACGRARPARPCWCGRCRPPLQVACGQDAIARARSLQSAARATQQCGHMQQAGMLGLAGGKTHRQLGHDAFLTSQPLRHSPQNVWPARRARPCQRSRDPAQS